MYLDILVSDVSLNLTNIHILRNSRRSIIFFNVNFQVDKFENETH